jgi:glycosyltransferase involved in cell wall biosynthesis
MNYQRLILVTDAWEPQVNGVVRSLQHLKSELESDLGYEVEVIHPQLFWSIPSGVDPEVRLAPYSQRAISKRLSRFDYSAIHIATEGPLGWAARSFCRKNKIPFTTAYHTRFPEYLEARMGIPSRWIRRYLKHFHAASVGVLVSTQSLKEELEGEGYRNVKLWSRGVDLKKFSPQNYRWEDFCRDHQLPIVRRPSKILLYLGRVAVEKNIEEFLKLKSPGLKVVVGDGPQREELQKRYPDAVFLGKKHPDSLSQYYSLADVFVFPSKTDTFGLVLLEALSCGTPIAAYPVMGPKDVVGSSGPGCLDWDLDSAVRGAIKISREDCRRFAESFSWRACAEIFISHLSPLIDSSAAEKEAFLTSQRNSSFSFLPKTYSTQ